MADPPTPDAAAAQATIDQQNAIADSQTKVAQTADQVTNSQTNMVQNGFKAVQQNAPLVAAALTGVGAALNSFTAAAKSQDRLSGFSDQLKALGDAVTRPNVALKTITDVGSKLFDVLGKLGGDHTAAITRFFQNSARDVAGATKELADYAAGIIAVGDELTATRDAMIQQAAASGNLEALYHRAGTGLKDFNEIATKQQKIWVETEKAMGLVPGTVGKMSAEFNKIPGVLNTMMQNMDSSNKASMTFQKSLELFKASGRDYASIAKDMSTAVMDFGLNEEHALNYTARLSVAAKALKIPVDELHKAITSSSGAFKAFVTDEKSGYEMTKNLESGMASYINMLRNAHVPMSVATDLAGQFAGAIGQMGIAQKAFLSQQTGGPGGLMGAFQIEKMMDEGKIDQVMGKVQDTLRKQFGRIVTTSQAAQSQAAAEQMTRQIMILRQGPLGQFAKSDAEARRLLDAMAAPGSKADMKAMTDKVKEEKPIQDFLATGNALAKGSQGIFNDILVTLQQGELAGAAGTARITQPTFGGATYFRQSPGETGGAAPEVMEERRRRAAEGRTGGPERGATLIDNALRDLKQLPASVKDTLLALGTALKTGNRESIAGLNAKVQDSIAEFRKTAAAMPEAQKKQALEAAQAASVLAASAANDAKAGITPPPPTGTPTTGGPTVPPPTGTPATTPPPAPPTGATGATGGPRVPSVTRGGAYVPPAQRVRAAIPGPAQAGGGATGTGAPATAAPGAAFGQAGRPMPVTLAPGSTISVNFVGVCPHCKSSINTTEAAKVVQGPNA